MTRYIKISQKNTGTMIPKYSFHGKFLPILSWNKLSKNSLSVVLFTTGIGSSGIGTFKNLQIGSQPSFKFQINNLSFGTFLITFALCDLN